MVRTFPRSLDALDDLFAFVEQAMATVDPAVVDFREIQLVVEELFTNCIRYNAGGEQEVSIEVAVIDDRLRVVVSDQGVEAFDITQVPALSADRPLSERRSGGMGLQMVRTICDRLDYQHQDGTSRITAEKLLRSPNV